MAEEKVEEGAEETAAKPEKKGMNMKLVIIIVVVLALLGAGGFVGYTMLSGKGESKADSTEHKAAEPQKSVLVPLDPFVVNLTEQGRYLKVTMQVELSEASDQQLIQDKVPHIRDAVITLLSNTSAASISGPEGKLQLKDELLLRLNQAVGKDVMKNLYFTEFVMQ